MTAKKKEKGWGGVTWEGYVEYTIPKGEVGQVVEYGENAEAVFTDLCMVVDALGYKVGIGRSPDGHGFRASLTGTDTKYNAGWTLCGYGSTARQALVSVLYKDVLVFKHIWPTNPRVEGESFYR